MNWTYQTFIAGKQKAIVAFVVTAVVAFFVRHGVALPDNAGETLQGLAWGVAGLVSVYLKRNQ